jgi:serine-type D-Ala-D-Ala carboxypeptidase (penicillin-binding protein 5/6)
MRRLRVALACVLVALAASAAPAAAADSPAPSPDAAAWLLVDAADGTPLASHAADARRSIASTTKLMTAYLTLRELDLGEKVTAPAYHPIYGESLMGLRAGERFTVRDLLYGLLLPSGNDAAVTLADGVAGSVPAFVARMNGAARRLGLDGTHYANPIGLDAPGNYSTAEDLATLAMRLRGDAIFRRIVDTPEKTVSSDARRIHLENTNLLLRRVGWVNGVKTGHTLDAGEVLVGSGKRKGVTLLSVVLGAPTEAARDAGTLALLDFGFSLYRTKTPVRRGERLGSVALAYRDRRLPAVAARRVSFTARKGQEVETRVVALRPEVEEARRGERLGTAVVTLDGAVERRIRLVAATTVPGPTLGDRLDSALPGSRATAWVLVGAALALAAALVIAATVAVGSRLRAR